MPAIDMWGRQRKWGTEKSENEDHNEEHKNWPEEEDKDKDKNGKWA
jgi:hypothetical protein